MSLLKHWMLCIVDLLICLAWFSHKNGHLTSFYQVNDDGPVGNPSLDETVESPMK